jgi:hypothetical protein
MAFYRLIRHLFRMRRRMQWLRREGSTLTRA